MNFYSRLDFSAFQPHKILTPPNKIFDPNCLDIHWVIPLFEKGAGGFFTILRFVSGLEQQGHKITLWLDRRGNHEFPPSYYKSLINEHFVKTDANVMDLPIDLNTIQGDAIIATDRFTCYPVIAMKNFRRRFYFVQDAEHLFFSVGSDWHLAETTYKFGFDCLCAGDWLKDLMIKDYGNWAMSWQLCVDTNKYKTRSSVPQNLIPKIACYSRFVTPRRCVELAFLAFDILSERGIKFHVDFFGWPLPEIKVGYSYIDHGIVSESQLADLYRDADIGVVFSGTNYSLVPKEMMATGLCVLELKTASIDIEFPDGTLCKALPDPLEIADRLQFLIENPQKREEIAERGRVFASQFKWEDSIKKVNSAIKERMNIYESK